MSRTLRAIVGGAAVLCAAAPLFCALAQPAPRIKARVVSFDGEELRLDPISDSSTGGAARPASLPGGPFTVSVLPQTRYAVTAPAKLSDVKEGDYAGAAVSESDGRLTAQEVFVYPPGLAGTGEGRFAEGGRTMVNGKVTKISSSGFSLGYRGAAESGGICMGRAGPPAIASALSCNGAADIGVPKGAPVMALSMGNADLVSPGAVVTVSLARDPQGGYVTPGLVIQKPANVENPAPSP